MSTSYTVDGQSNPIRREDGHAFLHGSSSQLPVPFGTALQSAKAVSRHCLTDPPSKVVAQIEQEGWAPPPDRKNLKCGEGKGLAQGPFQGPLLPRPLLLTCLFTYLSYSFRGFKNMS